MRLPAFKHAKFSMKILAVNAFDQFGCQKSFDKVLPTYFWKRFSCFSFPEKRKTKRKRVFQFVLSKIVPFSVSLFDLFFSCYFFIFSNFATFSPWKNFIFFLNTSCFCFFKNLSLFSSLIFFPTSSNFRPNFFPQLLLDFKARVSGPPLLMVAPWPQRPTSSHRAPPRSEWNTRRVLRFVFLYKKIKINWKEWWFHVEIKICHIIILILSFYLYIIFPSIISIYFVYFFAFFSIFSDTVIQEKWGKTSH